MWTIDLVEINGKTLQSNAANGTLKVKYLNTITKEIEKASDSNEIDAENPKRGRETLFESTSTHG